MCGFQHWITVYLLSSSAVIYVYVCSSVRWVHDRCKWSDSKSRLPWQLPKWIRLHMDSHPTCRLWWENTIPSLFFFSPGPCAVFFCPLLFLPSYVHGIHTFCRSRLLRPLFLTANEASAMAFIAAPTISRGMSHYRQFCNILVWKVILKTSWRPDGFKYGPSVTVVCLALSSLIQITASGERSDKSCEPAGAPVWNLTCGRILVSSCQKKWGRRKVDGRTENNLQRLLN